MSALVGNLRDAVPTRARVPLRRSVRRVARATSARRPLPEFLIIGTKRGGTTTLFRSLQRHPLVLPMFPTVQRLKSPHYFDLEYDRGEAWYRSHFATRRARRATDDGQPITGEASPYYLFHPLAPGRVSRVMPEARLIVLLRDPTARAFSHYWDRVKEGMEPLSFGEAIDREESRLAGEEERLRRGTVATSAAHEHFSYVARGRYAEQLERWYAHFPRQNVLVMRSEDLYADPQWAYARAVEFLGLPPAPRPAETKKLHGHADRPVIPAADEARLREYFAPHNRRLAALLDTEVWW